MANNNWKIVFFLSLFLIKCTTSPLSLGNNYYKKAKLEFAVDFKNLHLTSHFPKIIKNKNVRFELANVSSSCVNQSGYFFLIGKKTDYQLEFNKIKLNNIFTSLYSSDNTIINLTDLKHNYFPVNKCNKFVPNTKPIPYFEDYDFNLGFKTIEENIKGDVMYNVIYTIPKDLKVYVLKAKYGNFFKKKCDNKRPETLKEWRHGYSKGIAVSDKENLIVFWTMIW